MKLIESFKSPNFNERKGGKKISYLILHYTAMTTCKEALEYMCETNNKVSAHFLISKKGKIFYLVDLKKRAWHAGHSYWKKSTDLNSSSIGIELDYSGDFKKNEKYNFLQIKSLCKLINKLSKEFNLFPKNILGHSDISPFRKIDPGEKFPWKELYNRKLAYAPRINKRENSIKNNELNPSIRKLKNEKILKMLGKIGYDTRNVKISDRRFKILIQAYQRHYRQSNISGELDCETSQLIEYHYKDLLT